MDRDALYVGLWLIWLAILAIGVPVLFGVASAWLQAQSNSLRRVCVTTMHGVEPGAYFPPDINPRPR